MKIPLSGPTKNCPDASTTRPRRRVPTPGSTTVAGNGQKGVPQDGEDAKTQPLVDPRAVAVDSKGHVYILERSGHALRMVDPAGKIHTVAGTGKAAFVVGLAVLQLVKAATELTTMKTNANRSIADNLPMHPPRPVNPRGELV